MHQVLTEDFHGFFFTCGKRKGGEEKDYVKGVQMQSDLQENVNSCIYLLVEDCYLRHFNKLVLLDNLLSMGISANECGAIVTEADLPKISSFTIVLLDVLSLSWVRRKKISFFRGWYRSVVGVDVHVNLELHGVDRIPLLEFRFLN